MDLHSFMDSDLFIWVILPGLIFLARICDQTIGTIRIVFLSRGDKVIAPILGFFEVLIWVLAIRQIMHNMSNIVGYIAYAGGFATGNFIGILIEQRIARGKRGKMNVIYTVIERLDLEKVVTLADRLNPNAFYSVENVLAVKEGIFPQKKRIQGRLFSRPPRFYRRMRVF